jgi:broad specificity phosphatase PhoE
MSTPLVLVRHASTALNKSGNTGSSEILRGHLNVPLSPKVVREAQETAEKLKEVDFDCILTSDLSRAADTAKAIAKATGKPIVEITRGARPWDVGVAAGKVLPNCLALLLDHIKKPDTPLKGGESFRQFSDRYFDFLDAVRRKYPDTTVLICTHHRCERLTQASKEAGGSLSVEEILENPDSINSFKRDGVPPAGYRTDIVLGKGPADDDDDTRPAPKRKATPTPPVGWRDEHTPIEPRWSGPQRNLWTISPGGKLDGMAKNDPLDLNPKVQLGRRLSQSWAATVLEPMKRGR